MSLEKRAVPLPETSSAEGRPRWKNPNDVVRIRRKLSRKSSLKTASEGGTRGRQGKEQASPRTPLLKRTSENHTTSSPSPAKRPRGGLQDISNSPVTMPAALDKSLKSEEDDQLPASLSLPAALPPPESDTSPLPTVPLDWALKTKVRFVSPFPFSWTHAVRPHHEASGLSEFLTNTDPEPSLSDRHTALQEALMLWAHPSLPFLKTFPHSSSGVSEVRHKALPTTPALLQDQQVLQTLRDDWSTSLCSVYQLLKCGQCPYFYLCAHQFTVLFMSTGVRGSPSISAIITPTTSGMRETLRKEGATVNLSLAPPEGVGGDDDECDSDSEEGGTSSWLTNMGLPVQDLPRLRLQRAVPLQESKIDNRPESAVLVEGTNSVHILFNFLLTSKTTIATTGSMAGVPPTILSPTAFKGATLRSLKVRQGSVRELSEGQMSQKFYLELTGPILPLNLYKLYHLFYRTQHRLFTAHFTNIDSTGAFNARGGTVGEETSITDKPYLQTLPLGQKNALRQLTCDNQTITWE